MSNTSCLVCPKKHQNHVKKRYQKRHPSINLKKMVKRNTGLVVDVRQNRLMKR